MVSRPSCVESTKECEDRGKDGHLGEKLLAVLNCHLNKVQAHGPRVSRDSRQARSAQGRGVEEKEMSSSAEDAEASDCISVSSTAVASPSSAVASLRGHGSARVQRAAVELRSGLQVAPRRP